MAVEEGESRRLTSLKFFQEMNTENLEHRSEFKNKGGGDIDTLTF